MLDALKEEERMTHERDGREGVNVHAEEFPLERSERRGIIVRYLRGPSRDPVHCQYCGGEVRPQGGMLCRSQACRGFLHLPCGAHKL